MHKLYLIVRINRLFKNNSHGNMYVVERMFQENLDKDLIRDCVVISLAWCDTISALSNLHRERLDLWLFILSSVQTPGAIHRVQTV